MIKGIDISANNRHIDHERAVKVGGVQFVYARANSGEGSADTVAVEHLRQFNKLGIKTGLYHFALPDTDPADDVEAFARVMESVYTDMLPALDLETRNGRTAAEVLTWAAQWVTSCQRATGRDVVIYTGPAFVRALIAEEPRHVAWPYLVRCPLWIAHYGVQAPSVPRPWTSWHIWQSNGNTIVQSRGEHLYGARAAQALRDDPSAKVIARGGIVEGVSGECDIDWMASQA